MIKLVYSVMVMIFVFVSVILYMIYPLQLLQDVPFCLQHNQWVRSTIIIQNTIQLNKYNKHVIVFYLTR